MFLTFLCGMQNSRPGVKISPRIEQHKLYNTFSKYLVHVSNNTESYPKKKKKNTESTMAWGKRRSTAQLVTAWKHEFLTFKS